MGNSVQPVSPSMKTATGALLLWTSDRILTHHPRQVYPRTLFERRVEMLCTEDLWPLQERPENRSALPREQPRRYEAVFLADLSFVLEKTGFRCAENREVDIDQDLLVEASRLGRMPASTSVPTRSAASGRAPPDNSADLAQSALRSSLSSRRTS
jgi:hypothetical protein